MDPGTACTFRCLRREQAQGGPLVRCVPLRGPVPDPSSSPVQPIYQCRWAPQAALAGPARLLPQREPRAGTECVRSGEFGLHRRRQLDPIFGPGSTQACMHTSWRILERPRGEEGIVAHTCGPLSREDFAANSVCARKTAWCMHTCPDPFRQNTCDSVGPTDQSRGWRRTPADEGTTKAIEVPSFPLSKEGVHAALRVQDVRRRHQKSVSRGDFLQGPLSHTRGCTKLLWQRLWESSFWWG